MSFIHDEPQTGINGVGQALLRHHAIELAVATIVLVTLVVTSFVDLAAAPLAVLARALYYVLPLLAGLLLANGLLRKLGVAQRFNELVHHSATVIVGAVFNDVLEWLLDIFRDGLAARIGWPTELVESIAYAAIFWSMCLLARALLARLAGTQRRELLPQAGLLGMLPDELRSDIRWMKAEGNYVDVYGADDHRLVNYVFSRAVEELRPLGMQVHRSYWVARDSLIRVESRKGRIYAVLQGGDRVPVSRSFVREVRHAVDNE